MSTLTAGEAVRLHAMHWVARVALRAQPPLRAKALVDRFAAKFPPLYGVETAQAAVKSLFPWGSCLSRAMAVAAAFPGAEVVMGVDPWNAARVSAHAWLEIDQERIDTRPGSAQFPEEIARLPPRRLAPRSLVHEHQLKRRYPKQAP